LKIILLLSLLTLTSCTSLSCLKKCGIFPDGCMSSCERSELAEDFCRGRVSSVTMSSIRCEYDPSILHAKREGCRFAVNTSDFWDGEHDDQFCTELFKED